MSELLDFAARVIDLEGGAFELRADGLTALLPAHLAGRWQAPEDMDLRDDGDTPLNYGSALLERMIETATGTLPVVCARLEQEPPRLAQVRAAAEHWTLRNGVAAVTDIRLGPQSRVWVDALATLNGDEKRELLVSSAVSAESGVAVDGFVDAAFGLSPATVTGAPLVSPGLLRAVMDGCVRAAEQQAVGFRAAMTRRFERDRARIEGYFGDLLRELDKRGEKGRLDKSAVEDKRRAMLADRAAKLDALSARFVLRIDVRPVALRLIEVHGAYVTFTLRRRKQSRAVTLEYDAATRRLVPPRCEGCGASALRAAACDDAVHLLCETCAPRAEGRVACSACRRSAGTSAPK